MPLRGIADTFSATGADIMRPYTHVLPAWPSFRLDMAAIAEPLAAVRHRQGRLSGRMQALGFPLQAEALLATLTEDVLKSSEIEGEFLDKDQVRSSLARRLGIDVGGLTPEDRHVEGIVEMMLDATQNFAEPLSVERLYGWHAALFPTGYSGVSKIVIGAWRNDRDGPMQVVSGALGRERVHFEAPAADRVPAEIERFVAWFEAEKSMDAVLKAAIAHLWFVTIHPFEDGNGRIARAIADLALTRSEQSPSRFYSMSAQIRAERKGYYDRLEATQKGDLEITTWITWFLGCLERAIAGAEGTLAAVFRKAHFWETLPGGAVNDRQWLMLNKLLDGFEGKLTSSKWALIAKCSQDTASRDIDDLLRRGVLTRNAAGGRSTSYSLVQS